MIAIYGLSEKEIEKYVIENLHGKCSVNKIKNYFLVKHVYEDTNDETDDKVLYKLCEKYLHMKKDVFDLIKENEEYVAKNYAVYEDESGTIILKGNSKK